MLRQSLSKITVVAALLTVTPALAQNVIVVPDLKPPPKVTTTTPPKPDAAPAPDASSGVRVLLGTWQVDQKGNPTCIDGAITFRPQGASGVSVSTQFGDFPGTGFDVRLTDGEMSFSNDYVDVFGDPQRVVYRGRLSSDRNAVNGKIEGSWQDGCSFAMKRQ